MLWLALVFLVGHVCYYYSYSFGTQMGILVSKMNGYTPGVDGTYAQNYQDTWLVRLAEINGWGRQGFFLDLGAHSGKFCSNSKLLEEKLGWKGVCVEPFPTEFEDRRCILAQRAIARRSGQLLSFEGCSLGVVTGARDALGIAQGCEITSSAKQERLPTATSISIKDLIACVGKADSNDTLRKSEICTGIGNVDFPAFVNVISLDIDSGEGQLSVVEDFPWGEVEVGVWIIERTKNQTINKRIVSFMKEQGYMLAPVENRGVDYYWVLERLWSAELRAKQWRIHPTGSRGC